MTPVDTARTLVDADSRHAVTEVISLIHPLAADRFKRRQLKALEAAPWAELKDLAGPRAKRLQAAVEHNQNYVLNTVYRVATVDEFRVMSPIEILHRRLAEAYRAQSAATRSRIDVVGGLRRDPETEYVVLERRADFELALSRPPSRVEVMTFKDADGVWQSMFDGGIQAGELFVLGVESSGRVLPA